MRTVVVPSYGPPEVLQLTEADRPEPADGEVLVRVEAIGLNPVEAFVRAGLFPLGGPPPLVLGWDVAGVVEAAGPGVDRFAAGDRVFGLARFPALGRTYAEYVTVPADQLATPPAELDAVHAAALPLVGLTAWQSLAGAADVQPGQHVLVHAGGGGVGHVAVQVAKALGARVTATASAGKADFVASLGADTVIDYRTQDVAALVDDADVVLDPVGGDCADRSIPMARPGGAIVSLLRHPDEDDVARRVEAAGRRFLPLLVHADAAGLAELGRLVAQGRLRVHVDRTFGLDELVEAHRLLQSSPGAGTGQGITGKLVAVP